MHRLKAMKECLVECVECQLRDLEHVDTCELGEVIDMIKDLEEAMYYCAKIKEIHGEEPEEEVQQELKHICHSCTSRENYIKYKNLNTDKAIKLKTLEKYIQDITQDLLDAIDGATLEEQQLLEKKMMALTTKISQLRT